jgi:flagellar biogenesis protein FliO
MEAVLNQNFVFVALGVFVGVILVASYILDKMENESE